MPSSRTERISVRETLEAKSVIRYAAALEDLSVNEFVVQDVTRSAEQTIRSHDVMTLNAEASQAFAKSIRNPAEPSVSVIQASRSARSRYHV